MFPTLFGTYIAAYGSLKLLTLSIYGKQIVSLEFILESVGLA